MGIIVFIGLVILIAWILNYLTTRDYVTVRGPISNISSDIVTTPIATTTSTAIATSTLPVTSTSTQPKITVATTSISKSTIVSTSNSSLNSTSTALTVNFTDDGFSPKSLLVKNGQTVTFINNASRKVWVSANPFPSASDYPAFNEGTGLAIGSSWNFTFTKIGTWFYHNHYSPGQGAKIVVSP